MRIPGIDYGAGRVQSLGRESPGSAMALGNAEARATIAKGNALATLTEATRAMLEPIHDRQVESDLAGYQALMTEADTAIKQEMAGKIEVSIEELTALGIEPPKSAGGTRTSVPLFEVQGRYYKARLAQASEKARPSLVLPASVIKAEEWGSMFLAKNLPGIAVDQRNRQRDASLGKFENAYYAAIKRGDGPGAEQLVHRATASRTVSRETGAELTRELPTKLAVQRVHTLVATSNLGAIEAELYRISSTDYKGPLTGKTRTAARTSLRIEAAKLRATHKREFTNANARRMVELEIDIAAGRISNLDLVSMAENGELGHNQAENWRTFARLRKLQAEQSADYIEEQQRLVRVGNAVAGHGYLNPANAQDRKDVDLAATYMNSTEGLEEMAVTIGIVPTTLRNAIEIGATTGDNATAVQALEIYGRLQDQRPWLVHSIDSRAKTVLEAGVSYHRGGLSPQAAMVEARKLLDVKPEVLAFRKDAYKDLEVDNTEALQDFIDDADVFTGEIPWYTSNPSVAANMAAEYDSMVEDQFRATGDLALSQKMAWAAIREVWGTTSTGGNYVEGEFEEQPTRVMKYAPERLYGASPVVTQKALAMFAEEHGLKNLIVKADSITARDNSYQIASHNEETGLLDYVPTRWKPGDYLEQAVKELQLEGLDTASTERAGRQQSKARHQRNLGADGVLLGPGPKNWTEEEILSLPGGGR